MKVTVVGAGNVGATCADVLATREIANEIVLLDIKEGVLPKAKPSTSGRKPRLSATIRARWASPTTTARTADSDVVVITSGLPRKPGMSRDDLIAGELRHREIGDGASGEITRPTPLSSS